MADAHFAMTLAFRSQPVKCKAVRSAPVCTADSSSVKMWEIARAISSAVTLDLAGDGHRRFSRGVIEIYCLFPPSVIFDLPDGKEMKRASR